MITKERLEELIKQGATIWNINYFPLFLSEDKIKSRTLNKDYFVEPTRNGDTLFVKVKEFGGSEPILTINHFFETKEEAEWYLEFENITRTETLRLPTWKKIKRKPTIISFMSKDWKLCKLSLGEIVAVIENGTKSSKKKYVCVRIDKDDHYFERTEKGYIEACKLCKKLFLGEEV